MKNLKTTLFILFGISAVLQSCRMDDSEEFQSTSTLEKSAYRSQMDSEYVNKGVEDSINVNNLTTYDKDSIQRPPNGKYSPPIRIRVKN